MSGRGPTRLISPPLGRVNGGRYTVNGKEANQIPTTVHRPPPTSLVGLVLEKIPLFLLVAASAAVTFLTQAIR